MCMFGGDAPQQAEKPPAPVTEEEQAVVDSRDRERRRQMAAAGQKMTMVNGAQGVTGAAPVATKQLLGQ